MSDVTIMDAGNELPKRFEDKDDYISFLTKMHGKKANKIQSLIDKDDWNLMQRMFTQKQLIQVAKDQRLIQTQRHFSLVNRAEEIINDVVITSLENRAKSILVQDLFKHKAEDVQKMLEKLSKLKMKITDAREEFSDYYIQKKKNFNAKYAEDDELRKEMIDDLVELRKSYRDAGQTALESIKEQLSQIERKISR
ncbi:hypothetical protein [uncultured Kordia sp.]|uniref:hypothetical protein n=1 Tax=uncultured Kordia sp. TaxID=507699 RepID=UPI0026351DD6|nr:hypothetical protein [uncultured Kordia sp.]